jgi:hypothetical protein
MLNGEMKMEKGLDEAVGLGASHAPFSTSFFG